MNSRPASRWLLGVALMVAAIATSVVLLQPRAAAESPPAAERGAVKMRMGRHGESLTGLGRAVVLLDLTATARLARQIADDEALARALAPLRKERDEGAESFAALQEELRTRAGRLAAEAGARNDLGVAESFGELAKTCVRCHRLYLRRDVRPSP